MKKQNIVIVTRHAESVANTEGKFQGQTYDTFLSDLGKKQAEVLANRLSGSGVTKIISSPLKRTYQTSSEIAKKTGGQILVDERIIETNHGLWEGKSKRWIKENYYDVYRLWQNHPSKVQFPKGEHFQDTVRRVEDFLLTAPLENGTVIVTHDNILRILLSLTQGISIDYIWRHNIEPAALTVFERNIVNGRNVLKPIKINDNKHLKGLKANISKHAL